MRRVPVDAGKTERAAFRWELIDITDLDRAVTVTRRGRARNLLIPGKRGNSLSQVREGLIEIKAFLIASALLF